MFLKCRAWQRSASKAHKAEDTRTEITQLSVKHKQVTKLLTNADFFFVEEADSYCQVTGTLHFF
jgi:hypothetical protein